MPGKEIKIFFKHISRNTTSTSTGSAPSSRTTTVSLAKVTESLSAEAAAGDTGSPGPSEVRRRIPEPEWPEPRLT